MANYKKHFAAINFEDGSTWFHEIPTYLKDKLVVGDTVVAAYDGELKLGTVANFAAYVPYAECNVGVLVDKVKLGRWQRVMEARQTEKLARRALKKHAENQVFECGKDEASKKILKDLKKAESENGRWY